ncbi:MAG: PilZ domain-containing protein, partial [Thermodesulfobacteriota bacterium]|nr:PilZ domain-containing protein [Thermodesulfobacteriota bacterium]
IVEAASVNVSETGLRFTTDEPIFIRLRIDIDGELMEREARLVWAGKNPEQGVDYGFEYTPDPEE